VPDH